ncbi:MAG TPA: hypothetical protein VMQ65_07125 [Candidatus Limnocylindria bacterium]|nr:hypothetical protein [Candidatus Limnocylindria bacterium]
MPPERIAESLPYINWTVLTALGVGTFLFVVAGRFRTDATRGYLAFTSFTAAVFAALAAASNAGLPQVTGGAPPDALAWQWVRGLALPALSIVALVYAIFLRRGSRATPVAVAGLVAAAAVLVSAAFFEAPLSPLAPLLLFVQLVALSVALGGVWAAMVLGHWYLVTPRLPEAPLVRFARWLTFVLAAQVVLFVLWTGLGAGPEGTPAFGALTGDWALFVWLRLLVGLVFPLVVSWAAIQTARTRSMESATGLLYINIGTIASGTILAAGLYFGAGLLV